MADGTKIEWTDATWNPITGCSLVSEGCRHCYAATLAATRLRNHPSRKGLARLNAAGEAKFTGEVRWNPQWLDQPLRWKRPRMIFVCAHADLFHENVPDEWIDQVFAVMALARHHTFQVLTKRAARMRSYLDGFAAHVRIERLLHELKPSAAWNGNVYEAKRTLDSGLPLPNVWLGVSTEDQARADERIPHLLATSAAVRWVSAEPLLGPVEIGKWLKGSFECAIECGYRSGEQNPPLNEKCHACGHVGRIDSEFCPECGAQDFGYVCPRCSGNAVQYHPDTPVLDWIVVGGESGHGARPMHPGWARSLRDQCAVAGVPFLFKQWGAWRHAPDRAHFKELMSEKWRRVASGRAGVRPAFMVLEGKRRSGRQLDGVEHNGFPEVRHG